LDPLDRPSAAQVVAILQNQSNKMMATWERNQFAYELLSQASIRMYLAFSKNSFYSWTHSYTGLES
jgi:hypothetical protein